MTARKLLRPVVSMAAARCHSTLQACRAASGKTRDLVQGRGTRAFHASAARFQMAGGQNEKPWNIGAVVVPHQMAYVVERFGKFHTVLAPGLNLIIPLVDQIAYVHSLKEEALTIPNQTAITSDNVTLQIDGVLYIRIVDAYKASYGVRDAWFAISQLAQTTMRSEIGKISLDQTFKDRETLNLNVVRNIQAASESWGVECLRYEIRDIQAPRKIKEAMDQQAEAERRKRAHILDSEAEQFSEINIAEGRKRAQVLASEGEYQERVNQARGEAEAILVVADATAKSIERLAEAIQVAGGKDAVALKIAEKYLEGFSKVAKESTTVLLPANPADPSSMIGAAMGVYECMQRSRKTQTEGSGSVITPERLNSLKEQILQETEEKK